MTPKLGNVVWVSAFGKERRAVIVEASRKRDVLLVAIGRGSGERPFEHVVLEEKPAKKAGFRKRTHFYVDAFALVSFPDEATLLIAPNGKVHAVPKATLARLRAFGRRAFGELGEI